MFVIKNMTDRDVVLDDLRVVLGPHKEIDLDRVAPRHLSESSPKLRLARSQQRIKVMRKDIDEDAMSPDGIDKNALKEMEDRLKAEFNRQLQIVVRAQTAAPQPDVTALTQTIQMLMEQLKTQPRTGMATTEKDSSDSGVADDITTKIHALAVKKAEQKVTGHVETESKTIKDDNIQKNIDELEGLL